MKGLWQIREWVGGMQKIVIDKLPFKDAWNKRKQLLKDNPNKIYSIYKSLEK